MLPDRARHNPSLDSYLDAAHPQSPRGLPLTDRRRLRPKAALLFYPSLFCGLAKPRFPISKNPKKACPIGDKPKLPSSKAALALAL